MSLMPDSDLRQAALEVEAHVASDGWDQSPRLFALVRTAELLAREPALAEQMGDDAGVFTLIEQDNIPTDRSLEDLLTEIAWPDEVEGCAAVIERIMLPPEAEADLPDDPDDLADTVAQHPSRRDVRLVAAVVRDGSTHSAVRAREPDHAELLEGPDLVPGLIEHLLHTLN